MAMARGFILALLIIAVPLAVAADCPTGTGVWCSGAYAYDGAGNIKAIGADVYAYDAFGRLVSGSADIQHNHAGVQTYDYDEFGNRTSVSRSFGATDCIGPCELNATIQRTTNHITDHGALYDAAGNLIAIDNATYSYDAASMLTHATVGSDDREFLYTADDERLATKQGVSWTWTVRGLDNKVLRELTSLGPDTSRQWSKDYVWRGGLLLASVTPTFPGASTTITQHYHLDHLGTPRVITNDNGLQIGVHAYYPFGAELNLTPRETATELMKFTGHERDQLASDAHTLDAMHARYEMGTMGRFLSVDPGKPTVEIPQSWNRYAYALSNPIKFYDPDGEAWKLYTTIGFSTKTTPVEIDPRSIQAYDKYLDFNLGGRLIKQRVAIGGNATPEAFEAGLGDREAMSIFIGHAYTNMVGIHFTDVGRGDTFATSINRNPIVCLAGCGSAAFAKSFGITSETKRQAFVGFAGNVNAAFLTRISAQLAVYLNSGLTVGDAVTKLREEYKKVKSFRIVLIGDPTVRIPGN